MELDFPKEYNINKKDTKKMRKIAGTYVRFAIWLLIGLITGSIIRYFFLK
jgi:hypothetical protein